MSRRAAPALVPNRAVLGAFTDARLMGRTFGGPSFRLWRALLAAMLGLACPDDTDPREVLPLLARQTWPTSPCREAWIVAGRRSGKTLVLSGLLVALAALRDHRRALAPGERAVAMLLAPDRRQARIALRFCRGLLEQSPMLAALVEASTAEAIHLTNRNSLEVHTASFRSTRGYSVAAVLCDELSFWRSEETASNPDTEIINAIRPALVTLPGALLVGASSPHSRRGILWQEYRRSRSASADPDVVVAQAPSRVLNPTIPQAVIDRALADDPARAGAEWEASFRADLEDFLTQEIVDGCTVEGRRELMPIAGQHCVGFTDPSGGASDSMTLAIAHQERSGRVVLDLVAERKAPFSPDQVTQEFAALLKRYGCTSVQGDRYGGEWPAERFRAHGISYRPADAPKSDLYLEALPLFTSGQAELLDHPRLRGQLLGLERRALRGGRTSVDHAPGQHDDVANAVCGALVKAARREQVKVGTMDVRDLPVW